MASRPALDHRGAAYPDLDTAETPYGNELQALRETEEGLEHRVLDNEKHRGLLAKLEDYFYQARLVQSENRYEMAIDDDFYDGVQWDEQDKLAVEARGQPALVFNEIRESINWVIGVERRSKMDFMVNPRTDEDRDMAHLKRNLLKYTSDVNKDQFVRSMAFSDAVRVGLGWMEDGIRSDPFDEPLFCRFESWRNMWYDYLDPSYDLSQSRYLFRSKWVDLDVAMKMYPERAGRIQKHAQRHDMYGYNDEEYFLNQRYYATDSQGRARGQHNYVGDAELAGDNRRDRVRLVEAWYRMPVAGQFIRAENPKFTRFNGMLFDADNDLHKHMVGASGGASTYDAIRMKVFMTVFIDGALLQAPSAPYNHDKFPFTPVWAFRRKRDNAPYGLIRNMRDPQEDLNKRRSKALFILATNQVVMDSGAVDDIDELRENAAAPDGIIIKKSNKELQLLRDNKLAEEHLMLEQADKDYIRHAAGVTPENLGHETNAISGRAIEARQTQGAVGTAELFDNLRFAFQLQGEKRLALIEQFYDQPKTFRILGERGAAAFARVNMVSQDEATGAALVENPITESKADFAVSDADYRETVRIAMFEQLMEMMSHLPGEVSVQLLDLVVGMSDLEGKDELARRIRQINGQLDPHAEETPEGRAEMQARQQDQEQQQRIEQIAQMAELDKMVAEAKEKQAESVVKMLTALKDATEVAGEVQNNPALAATIDAIVNTAKDVLEQLNELPGEPMQREMTGRLVADEEQQVMAERGIADVQDNFER